MTSHPPLGEDLQIHLYVEHAGRSFKAPTNTETVIVHDGMSRLWRGIVQAQQQEMRHRKASANRTMSARKRAGTRRNRRHPMARRTLDTDRYGAMLNMHLIGAESKPNHARRFTDIREMFPLAPGQSIPVKRWG